MSKAPLEQFNENDKESETMLLNISDPCDSDVMMHIVKS
jgi:hypothetical protein